MKIEKNYTPGPWRIGKHLTTVVSDSSKFLSIGGVDDTSYYSGYLIGESIENCNAQLIAAAPDLVEALIEVIKDIDEADYSNAKWEAKEALRKAGVLKD